MYNLLETREVRNRKDFECRIDSPERDSAKWHILGRRKFLTKMSKNAKNRDFIKIHNLFENPRTTEKTLFRSASAHKIESWQNVLFWKIFDVF